MTATGSATVLGVDGCRGSWLAVRMTGTADSARCLGWSLGRFAAALDSADQVVAVDIPVGLAPSGRRACDLAGRAALGSAAARLFLTPPPAALAAADLGAANALLSGLGEPGMSAQMFGLRHAIAEVAAHTEDARVAEVHPELSFRAACGRVLPPKRTAAGVAERVAALAGWTDVLAALAHAPACAPADDALDALAAAWTGLRIVAGTQLRYPAAALGRPLIQA
jgi:predicted RNase H-like nuclease